MFFKGEKGGAGRVECKKNEQEKEIEKKEKRNIAKKRTIRHCLGAVACVLVQSQTGPL